jgi:hypothetical protein
VHELPFVAATIASAQSGQKPKLLRRGTVFFDLRWIGPAGEVMKGPQVSPLGWAKRMRLDDAARHGLTLVVTGRVGLVVGIDARLADQKIKILSCIWVSNKAHPANSTSVSRPRSQHSQKDAKLDCDPARVEKPPPCQARQYSLRLR